MMQTYEFTSLHLVKLSGGKLAITGSGSITIMDKFVYIHKQIPSSETYSDYLIPFDLISAIEFDRTVL